MLSADKVSEIFCIADDFCKEYDVNIEKNSLRADGKRHRRRKGQMSDSEIMTILICFHFNTYRNFKHYYLCYVKGYLKDYFPNAVSYNRFVELESRVAVQMAMFLELFCFGECTGISFIDSTCIPVCHNKRINSNKVFKGYAERGKSTMGWYYGFKLHLICNERGRADQLHVDQSECGRQGRERFQQADGQCVRKDLCRQGIYLPDPLLPPLFQWDTPGHRAEEQYEE